MSTARRPPPPLPVTILTGFLGAGKTTLLNGLLADPALADTAVLINEFGEIGLDHLLVKPVEEGIIMLSSGCVCCSVRGDLVAAFEDLLRARDNGRITPFSRVVVETTGLADPIPIIHTLMAHPYLALRLRLDAVVCVVDAVNGLTTLEHHAENSRQIASADRIVISKTDLLTTPERKNDFATLSRLLKALAPLAKRLDAAKGEASAAAVLQAGLWNADGKSADVRRWLALEAAEQAADNTSHHDGVKAFCLTHDKPLRSASFEMFLDFLRSAHGPNLLRVKGLVQIAEMPERPLIIHGAQHLMHPVETLEAWPDDDHRTRLVFIVKNLEEQAIKALFHAFAGVIRPDQPDSQALMHNPLQPFGGA